MGGGGAGGVWLVWTSVVSLALLAGQFSVWEPVLHAGGPCTGGLLTAVSPALRRAPSHLPRTVRAGVRWAPGNALVPMKAFVHYG